MPSKLLLGDGVRDEDFDPLVFCAGVLVEADGPGGSGRAGCALPGVWVFGIDRNGGDLSWCFSGPESLPEP
jgi:hypothetical protein